MDKNEVISKLKKFAVLVNREMKPTKIILYGSYAKGTWREDSDIDVAVVVASIEGDFLDAATTLFKIGCEIDTRIEPILLEEKHDESGFLEEVVKHGEVIYSK